jgi:ribosomal protein S18 acetylase RimI-like enzyme
VSAAYGKVGADAIAIRQGTRADTPDCVALWTAACAARDGRAVPGVADRARSKFERIESWIVAEKHGRGIVGFALATVPGSGISTDPPGAPVIGLLAVSSESQGAGLGGALLDAVSADLARRGYDKAVLHVLADNQSAVRLYSRNGWKAHGEPFAHALLKRDTQTYTLDLR